MRKILINFLIFLSFCFSKERVKIAIYAGGGFRNLKEEEIKRILKAKEVEYILTQEAVGTIDEKTKKLYELFAKNGKKIILDIWWGPCGDYNWDKYNFPDIAQDENLRKEFFEKVIDPVILSIGEENLYGVHMLEETGSWYGYEKTVHPYYKMPDVNTPNIRKYNWLLKKETGLDMDLSPIWNNEEKFAFWRWASKTISSSSAHKVFCEYIHKKYPKLKAFQFEGPPDIARMECLTEYKVMLDYFDGIVTDNYSSPKNTYLLNAYRTMAPTKEIVALIAGYYATEGTDEQVKKIKEERFKYAYLAGMNGIGFFEPDGIRIKGQDFQEPKVWEQNLEIFKKYYNQPVYNKKREILITSTNLSVGGYGIDNYLPYVNIENFSFIPAGEIRLIKNLEEYEVIIIFGPNYPGKNPMWNDEYMNKKYNVDGIFDYKKLNNFVEKGGILVISGVPLEKGSGLYITENEIIIGTKTINKNYALPNEWAKKNLKLKDSYKDLFTVTSFEFKVSDKAMDLGENTGYLVPYGKGYFLILPHRPSGRINVKNEERENYGNFLTDILNGLFNYTGKKELLKYIKRGGYYE
ncbi:MAG: glycoside hydrolase family 31 protein [Candidatus Omnitrophica bacterium]|nr:glycoside hydrolase family 31 protein [Candidatus Omnitrophota bacterium]